jgi:rfaE bifunctional protein kinase chain/domain
MLAAGEKGVRIQRLQEMLAALAHHAVAVVGDFFLDQYWITDAQLAEVSLETGRTAHQITEVRLSPGAAGTVACNLSALGVGRIEAVGLVGDDGNGLELLRALERAGVSTSGIIRSRERWTPVYTKPLLRRASPPDEELERFDLKNRLPTPLNLQAEIIGHLERVSRDCEAVLVLDQVQEEDCGVITGRVRQRLAELGESRPDRIFLADSRTRIGLFHNIMIKPNQAEAAAACPEGGGISELCRMLQGRSRRPVFVTRGIDGISLYDGTVFQTVAALQISGPLDTVGAGDSANAALAAALAAGGSLSEAAQLAVLAASVTIQKLGTTGTASPEEILTLAGDFAEEVKTWPDR